MSKDIRYNNDRLKMGNDFYSKFGITAQTAQIRIEETLVDGQANYSFDIKKAVKAVHEKVIKNNDLFLVRAHGLFLTIEKNDRPGSGLLLTYPLVQSNALPAHIKGFDTGDVAAIYNGSLTVMVDNTVINQEFPTNEFLHIPEVQPISIVNAAGTALISAEILPQFKLENGLFELPEVLAYPGNHEVSLRLNTPIVADSDLSTTAGYTAKVVYIAEGWNFAGGAKPEYKKPENKLAAFI